MKRILITGCNRGIGLELVKQLVAHRSAAPQQIITTCRSLDKAKDLQSIAEQHNNIKVIEMDVTQFDKLDAVAKQVANLVGDDGLNVLVNNAGVATKFTRLNTTKPDQMIENFMVNTLAPLMLTKALAPLLKKAAAKHPNLPLGVGRAAVINISSILGSIECNKDGGYYPYRTSKAGLNAVTRSLSIDLKPDNIIAISMHPGWLQTDMGGPKAPLSVQQGVSSIIETLLKLDGRHTGTFLQYDGKSLPW